MNKQLTRCILVVASLLLTTFCGCQPNSDTASETRADLLDWQSLPDLPNELGVAGPFVGLSNDALIVAGGANFPQPIWESEKAWYDSIHVLTKTGESGESYEWKDGGTLPRKTGYGAAVSTRLGIICMGGNDGVETFDDVYALNWEKGSIQVAEFPKLPKPCAYGQATLSGVSKVHPGIIYLAGGQWTMDAGTEMANFWRLDLSKSKSDEFAWEELQPWSDEPRAFNLTVKQNNGYDDCIYVISGRRKSGDGTNFLTDVWEFNPVTDAWRQRADAPRCVMAGTAIDYGPSHVFVLGGDDGERFHIGGDLKDEHPGFNKDALLYHTITNTWVTAGDMPQNQVTTIPVKWDKKIVLASGEVKPKVRTAKVWAIGVKPTQTKFGTVNYGVLVAYLLGVVGVGLYFARRNKSTDDFFRGGKRIPWWAAGCSIFATMLSSLTYTGLPSKSFAQDWTYAIPNMMIPVVAIFAVYVVLPFYRRIDATSAYEFLEQRFDRRVRLFASGSFTLYHVFRMAIVMSLTGLALAVATPLTPLQSVLIMGVLSILYCTLGGIEAVIWTDTMQTFVLLGGALLALAILLLGTDGGVSEAFATASSAEKFRLANVQWEGTVSQMVLWVAILGGLGQNVSVYAADQAVVQRYMTTASEREAARSIWTNAFMSILATVLFFGIGTALYAFYHSHPAKLDPTINADQVFPLFIANEMPIGLAGLIVAGVFAAAQSTVSTSMNSMATTIVTDFMRPVEFCKSETDYLKWARILTFLAGVLGTLAALLFIDPEIKSLFDKFVQVISIFLSVLGGLFLLGVLTKTANATGAMVGALAGVVAVLSLPLFNVHVFLGPAAGVTVCVVVGMIVSLLTGGNAKKAPATLI